MIYWINDIQRNNTLVPPIHRLGFLDEKHDPILRNFDHISFSLFTGSDLDISFQIGETQRREYEPCYTLGLPGDRRTVLFNRPADEFYCVYDAQYVHHFFKYDTDFSPRLRPLSDAPVVAHYAQMLRTLVMNHPISPCLCEQIDLICHALFLAAFRNATEEKKDHIINKRMLLIENELRRRYREPIDYDNLAKRNNLSFSSLRRLWHEHHDKSPHEFIMDLRNHEACELLKDRLLMVSEVARAVGYDDPQYFSRFFVRHNHCTPSQYQKKYIKDQNRIL